MSTTTAVRAGTLPRVNLLPTEIAEGAKFRNAQIGMGMALALAVGVVGALWYLAAADASDSQDQLAASQAQTATLQAQVTSYADVPRVYAQRQYADAEFTTAMGQEVRYSFLLNDLSLSIPSNVWLTELNVSQPVDQPGSVKGAWGDSGVASVTFNGYAGKLTDVAAWLDALGREKAYADPFVSNASGGNTKPATQYTFNSSVIVTNKGLSNRYAPKAGG